MITCGNMFVEQDGSSYSLYLPTGVLVGKVEMPPFFDGRKDLKVISCLVKNLYARWNAISNVANPKRIAERHFKSGNMWVEQHDSNYWMFLQNRTPVLQIALPPDGAYMADQKLLDNVAVSLETRWNTPKRNY